MSKILVTGLNPAWQKVLEFEKLKPGQINRAYSRHEFGSGKGLNAALVLRGLGHQVTLVQVVGGTNGERLKTFCRDQRINMLNIEVESETRVCSTLLDNSTGEVTELIEPFSVSEQQRVEERILAGLGAGSEWDAVVMSGTAPTGVEPGIYLEIARRVRVRMVVLDVVRELSPELLAAAHLVKINAHEFEQLRARGLKHPMTLLTDGPRAARLLDERGGRLQETVYRLPALEGIRNPIGAGDTVTAWLTHGLLVGQPVTEAFRNALAAGSASCLSLMAGQYDEATRREIAGKIEVVAH